MRPNWLAILPKWSRFYNNIIGCFNCLVLPAFHPAKCFLRLYIAPWFPSYLWFSTLVLATTCCDDSTPTGRLVLPPIDVPHLPAVPSACFFHACLVFSLLSVFILACCFMFPPTCVPMTWRFHASFGFSIPACYSQCPGVLTLAGYLLYLVFPLPSVFIAGISG